MYSAFCYDAFGNYVVSFEFTQITQIYSINILQNSGLFKSKTFEKNKWILMAIALQSVTLVGHLHNCDNDYLYKKDLHKKITRICCGVYSKSELVHCLSTRRCRMRRKLSLQ